MSGGGQRQIPGFYYDEERQRYFAVPTSSHVAEFNSQEIHQLDSRIKHKRRKQEKHAAHDIEKVPAVRVVQDEYFAKLESMQARAQRVGITHKYFQDILSKRSNSITCERDFQTAQLTHRIYVSAPARSNVSGMRLAFTATGNDFSFYGMLFYLKNNDPRQLLFDSKVKNVLQAGFSPDYRDLKSTVISDLYQVRPSDLPRYAEGCNGFLVFEGRRVPEPSNHLQYVISETSYCSITGNRSTLHIKDQKAIRINSDVTCTYNLNGIIGYGCRNGEVVILMPNGKQVKIELSLPVCGLVLMNINKQLYCVISNVDSKLRSYIVNTTNYKAEEYISYHDYNWSWRLSKNIKNDSSVEGIFCVESETTDPQNLELLFYSVFCPKPLKMRAASFIIGNTNKSETEWTLFNKKLAIFSEKYQCVRIYQSPKC